MPEPQSPLSDSNYIARAFRRDDPAEYRWEVTQDRGRDGCGCRAVTMFFIVPIAVLDGGLVLLFLLPYPRFVFWLLFSATLAVLLWVAKRMWSSMRSRDASGELPVMATYVLFWAVLYVMSSEDSVFRLGFGGPTADLVQWLLFGLDRILRVLTLDLPEVFGWSFSRITPETWYAKAVTAVMNFVIAISIVAALVRHYRLRHRGEVFYGRVAEAIELCDELDTVSDHLIVRRTARVQPLGDAIPVTSYQLRLESRKAPESPRTPKTRRRRRRSMRLRLTGFLIFLYRVLLFAGIVPLLLLLGYGWSVPVFAVLLVLLFLTVRHIAYMRSPRSGAHRASATRPLLVRAAEELALERPDAARELYDQVIAAHEQKFGTHHPSYVDALLGVARLEPDMAKRKQAIADGLAVARILGDTTRELRLLEQRHRCLIVEGTEQERIDTMSVYARVMEQLQGPRSVHTAHALVLLSRELLLVADVRGAYLPAARAMEIIEADKAPQRHTALLAAYQFGWTLVYAGRYADAERCFLRAAEDAQDDEGRRMLARLREALAIALLYADRAAEALPFIAAARAEAEASPADAASRMVSEALVLCAAGEVDRADRTCKAAWTAIVAVDEQRQLLESAGFAAQACIDRARGRLGAARSAQMRAIRRASTHENDLPSWYQNLAEITLALGDHHEAVLHARQAVELIQARWGDEHPVIDACLRISAAADERLPHETPWTD